MSGDPQWQNLLVETLRLRSLPAAVGVTDRANQVYKIPRYAGVAAFAIVFECGNQSELFANHANIAGRASLRNVMGGNTIIHVCESPPRFGLCIPQGSYRVSVHWRDSNPLYV